MGANEAKKYREGLVYESRGSGAFPHRGGVPRPFLSLPRSVIGGV
jgi:hypothetical protein